MNQQKIQNRLGNYQVVGLLSYGSTSQVFKIKEIDLQSSSETNQKEITNNFQFVTINMEYHRNKTIIEDSGISQLNQNDWILKLYNLERMVDKNNQFLQDVKYDVFVEMLFLTYLQHPGIVKAKQMLLEYENLVDPVDPTKINKKLIKAGIVMEICEKGCFNSLINYINRTKNLKENKVNIMKFYLTQVANTLMHLNQQCKILHRDLKAQNIMVNRQLDIKVIDYGVSKINISYLQKIFSHPQKQIIFQLFGFQQNITVKELYARIRNHESNRKNLIGSKHYISPELVEKYRSDMELVDEAYQKTDIWSFGVLMYKIFHDKYPFEGRNQRQTLDMIIDEDREVQISADLPKQVVQVIRKCLNKDYQQRATWKDVMEMRYFSQLPMSDIFNIASPIGELILLNKKEKQKILLNTDRIFFDEKLVLKYDNEGNKKRRVMLIKQKDLACPKLLVLKQKESISLQIILWNQNCLQISQSQNYLNIHYQNQSFNETIQICNELSKEIGEKLVQSILQAFQVKESKLQTKQISTGQLE